MNHVIAGAFLLIGLALAYASIGEARKHRALRRDGFRTTGVVVGNVNTAIASRHPVWAPRIRFTDERGTIREFQSSHSSRPAVFDIGDEVAIAHFAGRPDTATIVAGNYVARSFLLLLAGTALFVGMPIWLIVRSL